MTKNQVEYAKNLAKKVKEGRGKEYNDKGGHAQENSFKVDFQGFLAETIFADIWGLQRPQLKDDNDCGYDFIMGKTRYQVKGSSYQGDDCLIIFPDELEKDFDCFVYINIDRNNKVSKHYPSIRKSRFKELCQKKDFGYGERLAVRSKLL